MTPTEHSPFLGLMDYQWSAISALATAFAAAIALLLPMAIDLRRSLRDRRQARRQMQNIVDGAYVGLSTLAGGLTAWCEKDAWEVHRQLSWSIGVAKRMDHYVHVTTLPDDVIDCCISTATALAMFAEATKGDFITTLSHERPREAHMAMTIGIHVRSVLSNLRARHRLTSHHHNEVDCEMDRAIAAMNRIPLDPRIHADF